MFLKNCSKERLQRKVKLTPDELKAALDSSAVTRADSVKIKIDSVYVTITEGLMEDLDVKVGDNLVFDVQGVPIKVQISGVRKLDWSKDPPNFFLCFPPVYWRMLRRYLLPPHGLTISRSRIVFSNSW
jgi:hypothetical protein